MTRIVFVIPTLDRSGAEKQLTLLATHLPRDEFDVRVIALTRGGPYAEELQAAGVPVTVLGKQFKFDPRTAWRLRRELRRTQPDIVHSWLFAANASTRLVGPRSAAGPKLVVSERCVDVWKGGWQLALDRWLIRRTDQLIGNSRAVTKFYAELGYPDERISVIPNAVLPPPRPPFDRAEFVRQLGYPDDVKLVGYVGRLAEQKRVTDLIWAAQLLRQADPRSRLLICGDGPQRDSLIHYARQVEASDYVRFLGHRPDAASLMQLVDVFWLASDFEGMSNSVMEAMACGKPVVVSDIRPNREIVDHGVSGYLIDVGDSVGFVQLTRKLFDSPQLAAEVGAAGQSRMSREFSVEAMVNRHTALYRRLTQS